VNSRIPRSGFQQEVFMSLPDPSDNDVRERHEYRGYIVTVQAMPNERNNWRAVIDVERDGHPVPLDAPESIGPFWETGEEACRAGLERARYLLDQRDGLPDRRNPARHL
jgi:hypothetical protein